jgi:hypothetical protein
LLESLDEREFFLVELWVFGDGEHEFARLPFLQLAGDVIYKKLIAGDWQAIPRVEVGEVSELASEFVA